MTRQNSINLNHDTATILTNEDAILNLTEKGAVYLGSGDNVLPTDKAGMLCYDANQKIVKISDGQTWKQLGQPIDPSISIVYAIVFG